MKARTKIISPIIISLFLLFVAIGQMQSTVAEAQANTVNDKCHPLDLVILLDESESMYLNNDEKGRRFDAAGAIIEYLGNHAVFLCREEGIQHRVSIVGFGDRANQAVDGADNPYQEDTKIYLDSVTIPELPIINKDMKESTQIWDPQRTIITDLIKNMGGDNLGATDHRSAFLAANDILTQWKNEPLESDEIRRQGVLMLTDGGSCVQNRGCYRPYINDHAAELGPAARDLMSELEDLTLNTGDKFPFFGFSDPDSVYIATVFLSDDLDRHSFGTSDQWRTVATGHGGNIYPVTSTTSLVATINDALDPVAGTGREPVECGEPVWIKPYEDNVIIFSAYPLVEDPSEQVTVLIDNEYAIRGGVIVSGNLSAENISYNPYRGNESYVFNSPVPGSYQVYVGDAANCTDALSVKVDSAPISSTMTKPGDNVVFPTVVNPPHYSNALNSTFELMVDDKNGQPLQEIDEYPLVVEATVKNGDYEQVYELTPVIGENGRYESPTIETPITGNYSWELKATVRHPNPDEDDIEIFRDNGRFSASPVDLLAFAIDTPLDGLSVPINRVDGISQIPETLAVAVVVTDADGNDIDVTSILEDWSSLFEAHLGDGTNVLETTPLKFDIASNLFVGQFSNGSIDNLHSSGSHIINVEADWGGKENYDELSYAPALGEASITIEQYEIKPLQLALTPPEEVLLHKNDPNPLNMLLKQNGLETFSVAASVLDPLTGETQFLNEVLADLDAFEVVVQAPSGVTQTIKLAESDNVAEQLLVGNGGEVLDESGTYKLSMRVDKGLLVEEYAWAETSYEAEFTRADTLYTNPTTWTGVQAVLLLIAFILLFIFVRSVTGGPTGSLVISDSGSRNELITLTLKKRRRKNRFKKPVLKQAGIERITVEKGYDNLVSVAVKETSGLEAPLQMEPGQVDDVGNVEIRYVNNTASASSFEDDFDDYE